MENGKEFRRGRHCVFNLNAHLVFVTKRRRGVLDGACIDALRGAFGKVCGDFGASLSECDGEDDHVHLLVNYPPSVSLSRLVNALKGVGSRRLRRLRPDVAARCPKGRLWSPSYFAASCGGAPLEQVAKYVRHQRVR